MAFHQIPWDHEPAAECRCGAVTIGNFDGVHRGHAALLAQVRTQAAAIKGPAVALTFDPHPLRLLRPESVPALLTSVLDRVQLLHAAGADHVLVLRTTPDLLQLSAAEFFEQIIQDRLRARAVVEGPNFGFGHQRQGNLATLSELCHRAGLVLSVVPPLEHAGAPISSSRIRNHLLQGAVRDAAELLGRPYRLRGRVSKGSQRGQRLGFPTANLESLETVIPSNGVYAVRVLCHGKSWPGAANIGPNPTFAETAPKVEVHLIGFEGDLYGHELAVDFLERLRDTRKFAGPNDLAAQLRSDVEQATLVLSRWLQDRENNVANPEPDSQLLQRVETVLDHFVRPALRQDGGDVEVVGLIDGVLRVRLKGTCSGCPSNVWVVIQEIEQAVRNHLPHIDYLEAVP